MDVRPCSNWEKQYRQNQKLLNKPIPRLIKNPSLPILREMPSMEEKNTTPLKKPTFEFHFQLHNQNPEYECVNENNENDQVNEIDESDDVNKAHEDDENYLTPEKSLEKSTKFDIEKLKHTSKSKLPENARDDQEFVLLRSNTKRKLTVEIKKTANSPEDLVLEIGELQNSNSKPKPSDQNMNQLSPRLLWHVDNLKIVTESDD